MDLDKLNEWLQNEENRASLAKLISGEVQEDPDPPQKKRRRKSKKYHDVEAATPQVLPQQQPQGAVKSQPVTARPHVNKFDQSSFKNEFRSVSEVDKKIKKSVSQREGLRNSLDMKCEQCQGTFTVHKSEIKHDGDHAYFICNRCMLNRRSY